MSDLANVAETPALVRRNRYYLRNGALFACCDVVEKLWPDSTKAERIVMRFSTEPSKNSKPLIFQYGRSDFENGRPQVFWGKESDGYAWRSLYSSLEEFLIETKLIAAEPDFTRTLHVSVHVHEET